MARTPQVPVESVEKAVELRDGAQTIAEFRRAIATLLYAHKSNNFTAEEISNILGVSRATLFTDLSKVKSSAESSTQSKSPGSGGRHNSYLTIDQESLFLSTWEKEVINGHILSIPKLHGSFNELIGAEVSKTTVYRMLHRHGWRKIQPDTKHPKADPIAQEDFKKNSPYIWAKLEKK